MRNSVNRKCLTYALYRGDKFIDLGTAKEIAERQGIKAETIKFMSRPAYRKRVAEWNYDHCLIVVKLEEDD